MKATFHLLSRAKHQVEHGKALEKGLQRHGVATSWLDYDNPAGTGDIAIVWTWRQHNLIQAMLSSGRHVMVIERGFLPDRMEWCSLAIDGFNGRGRFMPAPDGARFEEHFSHHVKPWHGRTEGYALVFGQCPGDANLHGADIDVWTQSVVDGLLDRGHRVVWRRHPHRQGQKAIAPNGAIESAGTLKEAMSGAAFCVAYNSNAAVDAVLAGIPTIAMDEGSLAWNVTSHSLDRLIAPDRTKWLHDLSYRQWTMKELTDGTAWDHISPLVAD